MLSHVGHEYPVARSLDRTGCVASLWLQQVKTQHLQARRRMALRSAFQVLAVGRNVLFFLEDCDSFLNIRLMIVVIFNKGDLFNV